MQWHPSRQQKPAGCRLGALCAIQKAMIIFDQHAFLRRILLPKNEGSTPIIIIFFSFNWL